MDYLLNAISFLLNSMSTVLGGWSFARDLAQDLNTIRPYLELANFLLPVDTALIIGGLWVGIQLALIAYYWITRALNLLRGAG